MNTPPITTFVIGGVDVSFQIRSYPIVNLTLRGALPESLISLCNLCVLCVSVVVVSNNSLTTEAHMKRRKG